MVGTLSFNTGSGQKTFRCEGAAIATSFHGADLILLRFKPQHHAVPQFRVLNEKIQALTREVQRRILAEEAVRQSETLFREMADAMPQIVWAARPDGTLDYYNRRWYELTGSSQGEIGDQSWLPILHPDDRERCREVWYQAVRTGSKYEIEYRFKFPHEPRYRWHLGRALPARDATGRIVRWFGTCTDIDDQKLAEERLERAVAQRTASLREALTHMEEFSYSVSHDLRAPVRAMQGYAEALLTEYAARLDDTACHYLERIARAGARMDKLILDVLTFSQLTRADVRIEPVALHKLVQEVLQQFPALQPPRADIQVMPLPSVLAHEPSLTQVVSNLLANAVKFVLPGVHPAIRIRSESAGPFVRVWFEDNGIGILPEHQERIFDLFERSHPDKKYEGTGLGLAIVRRAMERMGGRVGVESDGVNGSRFWIELLRLPAP